MHRFGRILVFLIFSVWATSACSSDSDGDGPPPTPDAPSSAAEVCERLAAATCAPYADCCGDDLDCARQFRVACVEGSRMEAAALEAAQARVDADAFADCLAATQSAARECALVPGDVQSRVCARIFVDVAGAGEPCASGLGGLRCAGGAGICFAEPTGTPCKVFGEDGDPCAAAPCAPGLHCIVDAASSVCAAPRALGEPCRADVHCAEGLQCEAERCAPQSEVGESCPRSSKCAPTLYCDPAEERCAAELGEGGECFNSEACQPGLRCVGAEVTDICWPSEPDAGTDAPGLPGAFERCDGECARGHTCMPGPIAGRCEPALCAEEEDG